MIARYFGLTCLGVLLLVALLLVSPARAGEVVSAQPEFYKAVVQGDRLYLKSRSGYLAIAPLDGSETEMRSATTLLRPEISDAWELDGGELLLTGVIDADEVDAGLYLSNLADLKAPTHQAPKLDPLRPAPGIGYAILFGTSYLYHGPLEPRPGPQHPLFVDAFVDSRGRLHTVVLFENRLSVAAFDRRAQRKKLMSFSRKNEQPVGPFVAMPAPDGVRIILIESGQELVATKERFEPAATLPARDLAPTATQAKGREDKAMRIAVVDKRTDTMGVALFRVPLDGGEAEYVPPQSAAKSDEPKDAQTLGKALVRAVAAVRKTRSEAEK